MQAYKEKSETFKYRRISLCIRWKTKKKDARGRLYKNTTENKTFLNKKEIFVIRKIVMNTNVDKFFYWMSRRSDQKLIKYRFLRQ